MIWPVPIGARLGVAPQASCSWRVAAFGSPPEAVAMLLAKAAGGAGRNLPI